MKEKDIGGSAFGSSGLSLPLGDFPEMLLYLSVT